MNKRQLQKAWEEIRTESTNIPKVQTPYPSNIVAMRELLLIAQNALAKIKVGENMFFYQELHKKIMLEYHRQKYVYGV